LKRKNITVATTPDLDTKIIIERPKLLGPENNIAVFPHIIEKN